MPHRPQHCLDTVRKSLEVAGFADPKAPLLAAVSGGPDSVAILQLLHELEIPVVVAHFDHQMRGEYSASDARFVEELAERLELPCYQGSMDVPEVARASSRSLEEVARELRYQFLVETAEEAGCSALITGHHADDQAETLLMRFLRGTSPRGLAGIPECGEREGFPVLRPMLSLTRDDILGYLEDRGVEYRLDPTNADPRFLRNRIRHELLPQLSGEYNPGLREALGRLAEVQRVENDFMAGVTEAFLQTCLLDSETIERRAFRYADLAVQRRALLEIAWKHGAEPDFDRVDEAVRFIADGGTGQYCDLGRGVQLCNGREDTLVVAAERRRFRHRSAALDIPGESHLLGKHVHARRLKARPRQPLSAYCTASRQVFDADCLSDTLSLRTVRDGDRFRPFGLNGTKKLSDYFSDIGLPVPERSRQVLLESDGEIVWILGHAVSASAAVTGETTHFVEVETGELAN